VDPNAFVNTFGTSIQNAQTLVEAKTLTISKLMTIMPPGTVDPRLVHYQLNNWISLCTFSPFLYNNTMYTMAGLVGIASVLHFMVKPVDKKFFEKE